MNAGLKAKNDALAQKLGLWQPEPCELKDTFDTDMRYSRIGCPHCGWTAPYNSSYQSEHIKPAPDLTSDAGHALLEKTLLERDYIIVQDRLADCFQVVVGRPNHFKTNKTGYDPDPAIALVLAAHKLLMEDSNG